MIIKTFVASVILVSTSSIAFADSIAGAVLAYDRKAQLIVLEDKTVWTLEGSEVAVPPDLKAGDRIEIDFEFAGDDGITKIEMIKRVAP